jgi:PASTA domain
VPRWAVSSLGDAPMSAPPNDDFANAIALVGPSATRAGDTNVDATLETDVRVKTLAAAKRKITAGHCRLGMVTKAKSKTVPKGKVISQSPRAGKKLARGAKVNFVLSRGRH